MSISVGFHAAQHHWRPPGGNLLWHQGTEALAKGFSKCSSLPRREHKVVPPAQAWPHLSTLVLSWNKWKVGAGPPSQPGLQLDAGLTTDTARDFAFDDDFHLVYLKVPNPRGKPIQGNVVHLNNNNKNQFIFSHSSLRYTCFRTGPGDSCWISQPNWKALWQVKASSHGRGGQEMESDTSGEGTVNEHGVNLLSQIPGAARVRVLGPRCPAGGSTA